MTGSKPNMATVPFAEIALRAPSASGCAAPGRRETIGRILVALLMCAGAGLMRPPASCRADEPRDHADAIHQIVAQWMTRANVARMRVAAAGTTLYPKGVFTGDPNLSSQPAGDLPPKDTIVKARFHWSLDFAGSRLRRECQTMAFDGVHLGFEPRHTIQFFNGRRIYEHDPLDTNYLESFRANRPLSQPELYIDNDADTTSVLSTEDYPVLFAAGCFHLSGSFDIRHIRKPTADQLALTYVGQREKQGRACVVLRVANKAKKTADSYDEYWVDTNRAAAIVYWKRTLKGETWAQVETWFDQDHQGAWRPSKWTHDSFMAHSVTGVNCLFTHTAIVPTVWELNPMLPERVFEPPIRPGMVVYDGTEREERKRTKSISPDGQLVEFIGRPVGSTDWPYWRILLIVNCLVVFVVAGTVVFWRFAIRARNRFGPPRK